MAALVDASGAEQLPHAGITDEVEAAAEPQSEQNIADNFYEFVTPEQMVALWDQCRAYLESGEPGAAWLADELQTPEISSLSHVGRAWGTTWAKAGWYPDDASGFATTVDAGVVRTETGDVVIAVMTTSPSTSRQRRASSCPCSSSTPSSADKGAAPSAPAPRTRPRSGPRARERRRTGA